MFPYLRLQTGGSCNARPSQVLREGVLREICGDWEYLPLSQPLSQTPCRFLFLLGNANVEGRFPYLIQKMLFSLVFPLLCFFFLILFSFMTAPISQNPFSYSFSVTSSYSRTKTLPGSRLSLPVVRFQNPDSNQKHNS
jgi:hypothetical protein